MAESQSTSTDLLKLLEERAAQLEEQHATLAPALSAFAAELPRGRSRRRMARLASQLESETGSLDLTQFEDSPEVWVPLLAGKNPVGSPRFLEEVFSTAVQDEQLRTLRIRNYTYPLIILLIALAVLGLLLVGIVPGFVEIFDDFELDLPVITTSIASLSRQVTHHPIQTVLFLAALGFGGFLLVRMISKLGFPGRLFDVFTRGSSRQVTSMALFVRQLVELLRAELPVATSLRQAGEQNPSSLIRDEAHYLAQRLDHPHQDTDFMWRSLLPPTVVYALSAGPEGQPNVALLETMSEIYAGRVAHRFNWATGILPQLGMLAVVLVVAYVVLALFLPLVELINGLTG